MRSIRRALHRLQPDQCAGGGRHADLDRHHQYGGPSVSARTRSTWRRDYWNNMVGEGNEANNVRSVTFEDGGATGGSGRWTASRRAEHR